MRERQLFALLNVLYAIRFPDSDYIEVRKMAFDAIDSVDSIFGYPEPEDEPSCWDGEDDETPEPETDWETLARQAQKRCEYLANRVMKAEGLTRKNEK